MRRLRRGFCAFTALMAAMTLGPAVRAQAAGPSDLASRADRAWRAADWTQAQTLYEQLTREQPESYIYWLRLGSALHRTGADPVALEALRRAQERGAPANLAEYQVALIRAALHQPDAALAALAKSVRDGHGRPDLMRDAPEFRELRNEARFRALVDAAEVNQEPCTHRPESRQFDFWIGDWNVTTTREHTRAGSSHIERTLGSCVIWENWTSAGESGYAGKSYNVYDDTAHRWEQFWVDNQGGMLHFAGALRNGVMDFRTDALPQSDGRTLLRHLRFFPIDPHTVRQLSEGSTDGGKSWQVEYDFTYVRAE